MVFSLKLMVAPFFWDTCPLTKQRGARCQVLRLPHPAAAADRAAAAAPARHSPGRGDGAPTSAKACFQRGDSAASTLGGSWARTGHPPACRVAADVSRDGSLALEPHDYVVYVSASDPPRTRTNADRCHCCHANGAAALRGRALPYELPAGTQPGVDASSLPGISSGLAQDLGERGPLPGKLVDRAASRRSPSSVSRSGWTRASRGEIVRSISPRPRPAGRAGSPRSARCVAASRDCRPWPRRRGDLDQEQELVALRGQAVSACGPVGARDELPERDAEGGGGGVGSLARLGTGKFSIRI